MAFLEWSDSLSVGFRLLDADHKRLIDIINSLYEASKDEASTTTITSILDSLISYTKTHFIHEETLMRKTAYPQFIPHKIEHDRLIGQIEDLRKRYAAGQIGLSQETIIYMRTWLCDHIIKVDRSLGDWLVKYVPQDMTTAS